MKPVTDGIEFYHESGGDWYWSLRHKGVRMADSATGFPTKREAKKDSYLACKAMAQLRVCVPIILPVCPMPSLECRLRLANTCTGTKKDQRACRKRKAKP